MQNNFINEKVLSVSLVILLVFFWNPFGLWMPQAFIYMAVVGLLVLITLYAGLFLRERPEDEREDKIRSKAGRVGFISGIIIISIGIIYQSLFDYIDPFLVLALAVMLVSKFIYFYKKL